MATVTQIALQLFLLIAITLLTVAIYRLYLHPLAKFPGPKLAALTSAYEGYYDCFKDGGGRYWVELHIRDRSSSWSDIYRITRRANKPEWFYQLFGTSGNTFSTVAADVHRLRRDAIQPYFSPAAVARHEAEVERLVGKLARRLLAFKNAQKVVNLGDAFRCLATDVATAFAFRKPFGHLESEDFEHEGNEAVRKFGLLGLWNRHSNGWVMKVMAWQLAVVVKTELELAAGSDGKVVEEAETNIIQQILNSSLPAEEKSPYRVMRECSSVTLAGTETTGSVLTVMAFHLLSNREKGALLREEIEQAHRKYGRSPSYQELKELPYLIGVVNEGLRLNSVSGRLPRYDPKQGMTYGDWVIPRGTIVATTQNDTHFSPDMFPDPHAFVPERWLDEEERKRLSKYLLPWGRGVRTCLGMEIALTEIYITLGRLFSPEFGAVFELFDTEYERDIAFFHDYFSPFPRGKKGLRAFVW
ncbi:cytochrome P450 [Bombardia bombarda]|uniref:Cytochrome P450 n=1 Tax=Bombardia bombarda TaxID=252184 RepID=A0AA39X189_9PEZI|nr:cytochrome P450 [Bombardia bombarda]